MFFGSIIWSLYRGRPCFVYILERDRTNYSNLVVMVRWSFIALLRHQVDNTRKTGRVIIVTPWSWINECLWCSNSLQTNAQYRPKSTTCEGSIAFRCSLYLDSHAKPVNLFLTRWRGTAGSRGFERHQHEPRYALHTNLPGCLDTEEHHYCFVLIVH